MCQNYNTTYACGDKVNEWVECERATVNEVRKTCIYNNEKTAPRSLAQDCAGCKVLKARQRVAETANNQAAENASYSRPVYE